MADCIEKGLSPGGSLRGDESKGDKTGSIFGEVQSGHIEQVGYDMYSKLLNEVVNEEKGEKVIEEIEVQIDIGISSFIPDNYIESSSQKIEIYQDIANCRTEADIMDVIDEITDR